jgi:hypothetical protein
MVTFRVVQTISAGGPDAIGLTVHHDDTSITVDLEAAWFGAADLVE